MCKILSLKNTVPQFEERMAQGIFMDSVPSPSTHYEVAESSLAHSTRGTAL